MQRRVFAPVITAIVLVLIGANMAVQLGQSGANFMAGLDNPDPALAEVEPTRSQIARPRLAERVFLVIIDGLTVRESIGLPYLEILRQHGLEATAVSHYPTFSRPNYVSIVTSVPPQWSGVRTNNYDAPVRLDSLMDRAKAAGMQAGFVSNYSPALPRMFTRPVWAAGEDEPRHASDLDAMSYVVWPGGFTLATRQMVAADYPLVILHLGEVDAAGHEEGGDSPEYAAAAQRVDDQLRRALREIDLQRDAVIVVADHGHTESGGHGGLEDDVVTVPLIMAGAGIRRSAAVVGARLIDVAPTAATLLGIEPPGHGLGMTLVEGLALSPEDRAAIVADDQRRVTRNQLVTSAALDEASKEEAERKVWRLPLVLAMFGLALAAIVFVRRRGVFKLDWRVLAIALPAFPATYYLALGLLEQQYSPSAIREVGEVWDILIRWGIVSTIAHIMASWLALRGRVVLRDRLAAANGLTICGLFLSVVPAGLAWAVFPGPFVELPSPELMVLIPATLIAVAFYAIASTTTLVLEIVIFFARAVDPRMHIERLERRAARARSRLEQDVS